MIICQIFSHSVNAKMEKWPASYTELTMPKIALYHTLGNLPKPEVAHRFSR
jgi:hypothetical protein